MKKLLLLLLTLSGYLIAMQPEVAPQVKEMPLVIKNLSNWDIEIHWKIDGETLQQTLLKGGELSLSDANKISSLKILPHGAWWGKVSREQLTGGLLALPDEVEKIKNALQKNRDARFLTLEITLPEGYTGGYFSPFITEVRPTFGEPSTKSIIPQTRLMEDVFPAAKKILYPGSVLGKIPYLGKGEQPISPRHILNVPIGASRSSIEHAYTAAKAKWERVLNNPAHPGDRAFAQDVLSLLDAAYRNLISGLDFEERVNAKLRTPTRYPEQIT